MYTHSDWLGTERVHVNGSGAACQTIVSMPFGDGQVVTGNCGTYTPDVDIHHFTGKERDSESGLDNFGARYYTSGMGRFMSPDVPFADQQPGNPQSWNLYSYTRNNPLAFVDDTGSGTRPAQSAAVNNALASDPTLNSVILRSVNFSPGGFEDSLNGGGLSSLDSGAGNTLRGLAGEATVIDDINGFAGTLLNGPNTAYPSPTNLSGVSPDIGVKLANATSFFPTSVDLTNVANSSGGTGNVTLGANIIAEYMEVKSGLSPSSIGKGVDQAVATAAAISGSPLSGRAVSALVVDAGAWGKLSPQQRAAYVNKAKAGGAYIQVQAGLADAARKRAQALIDKTKKKP